MDWQHATLQEVQTFALIFVRVTAVFMAAPILGSNQIPSTIRVLLAVLVSVMLLMAIQSQGLTLLPLIHGNILVLLSAALGEALVGLAISYTAFLFFSGIQMAGQIIDIQIGFGLVNVLDPSGNDQVSILGQFYYILAILYFLAINGHHDLLRALGDSFRLIPPGRLSWFLHAGNMGPTLTDCMSRLFIIAIQVSGPPLVTLFLTSITMGLLSRTIPQMNVFIIGMPVNILIGLGITILSLKLMSTVLNAVSYSMSDEIARLLHALMA